ncbi:RDD family protein [Corynebacterium sp. KPL2861]|uniref:RDD family protein n=1 Tax=Corynebacterium sp. KPL2861 TaxID=3158319 RepID=UPI0032ED934C
MIVERLKMLLRRAVAWWIDAFLVAAIITVLRWVINALADAPLSGRPQEIYDAVALALVFYIYRVWVETKKSTSLGKWSMQLEIIPARSPLVTACLRNSWLLLTPLTLTGWGIDAVILIILGLSVVAIGQTPFDLLAGCLVEKRPQADSTSTRGQK